MCIRDSSHRGITSKGRPLNSHKPLKYLCFTAIVTTLIPQFPPSSYQSKLHKKILELQKSGLGYRRIAYWLNDNGYKTPRGHKFKNTHVFSILKKKRIADQRMQKSFEPKVENLILKLIYLRK